MIEINPVFNRINVVNVISEYIIKVFKFNPPPRKSLNPYIIRP